MTFSTILIKFIISIISRNRLRTAMNETTYNFLGVFTPKLDELFDKELSSVYLNSMNEHLQTFYDDVLSELQTKENTMSKRIEGMHI